MNIIRTIAFIKNAYQAFGSRANKLEEHRIQKIEVKIRAQQWHDSALTIIFCSFNSGSIKYLSVK